MQEVTLKLQNKDGLHARPAGVLAKTAASFSSQIEIRAKGQVKNAKSIMSILSLGLEMDDEIMILANGSDESQAIAALENLVRNDFVAAHA